MHPNESKNRYYLRTYKFCCLSQSSELNWGGEKIEKSACPVADKRICLYKIKLDLFQRRRKGGYWDFHHATLCQKSKTSAAKERRAAPKQAKIETVTFPPKGLFRPYFPGRFSGKDPAFLGENDLRDFFVIRKAWARNIAHQENLIPGQSTRATFDGQEFTISIGPRWGVNIR